MSKRKQEQDDSVSPQPKAQDFLIIIDDDEDFQNPPKRLKPSVEPKQIVEEKPKLKFGFDHFNSLFTHKKSPEKRLVVEDDVEGVDDIESFEPSRSDSPFV